MPYALAPAGSALGQAVLLLLSPPEPGVALEGKRLLDGALRVGAAVPRDGHKAVGLLDRLHKGPIHANSRMLPKDAARSKG